MDKSKSKTGLLLFFLVLYVVLQLVWWGYLLSQLNKEVFQHKIENISLIASSQTEITNQTVVFEKKLNQRLWMIFGEGSVFVIILTIGVVRLVKVMNAEHELNKRQHNFLLSVTHELKSPLASARLQLETILKRSLEKEKQDLIVTNAISDLDRLNSLTDNILTATQLDNSNLVLNLKQQNVSELIKRVVQNITLKNPNRIIQSTIQSPILYSTDENALTSIVTNLLENAIKYSDTQAEIKVNLSVKNEKLQLQVMDVGIGISDSDKKEIFKKFYRVGSEETRKTKGTGLGLFIIKQFVDALKGTIKVENNSPKGTIFTVIL